MKKCKCCGVTKQLRSFYSHPQCTDGRYNKCSEMAKPKSPGEWQTDINKDRRITDLKANNRVLKEQQEAIGTGGVTGLRGKSDAALWCVHVYGPDDVYSMPSRAAALEEANGLNAVYARTKWDEHTPIIASVVETWPHSVDRHAADVALLLQCQANRAAIA